VAENYPSDDLVERAREFDPDAWETLYRRAYDMLFGYAFRRLGSVDASEDAVSETMMRAMKSIDRYVPTDRRIDAWLVGIMRNVVLESWRASARDRRGASLPVAVADAPAIEGILAEEEAREVRQAFSKLSAEEQEVLELRVVLGLTAEDVGQLLRRKPGAVRMAQHRALGRLRSTLSRGGHDV
jgi:RNA polymerase sigma-70 factor (ECF subfamily)